MKSANNEPGLAGLIGTILAPFALGYLMSYLFRALNAIIAPDLIRDVGLSASELGLLTSAYLLAFALFQIPLGMLLDRFGPRRVQAALLSAAAVGAVAFATGTDIVQLTAARALIGLGFAGGLMASFKVVVLWVPQARVALANSAVMSVGGLGILFATLPAETLVQAVGWRQMFFILAAVTFCVAAAIFLLVREKPASLTAPTSMANLAAGLRQIFSDRWFWHVAPLVALTAGSHIAIQTLWAGPWLADVAGMDRDEVALCLLVSAIGFLVGVLASGITADLLTRRGVDLMTVMTGGVLIFFAAQIAIIFEFTAGAYVIWAVFSMVGQIGILAYARMSAYFGTDLAGRANTAVNLIVFLTAFGVQFAIGAIIDLWWPSTTGTFEPRAYQVAFATFLVLQVAALIWYFCRPRADA